MNPLQNQTTDNDFIEGELSEEELMEIVGGLAIANISTTINPANRKLVTRTDFVDGTFTIVVGT
ncbi:MAG: hypothetical protein RMY62_005250 [Nostoc sp. ZfuVER08]|uniref:Bacteriocin n=1 Tax=Nostoc punctiforme FACHB-252 TaxID=1357509 RepID=A0ABR8HAJ9_NOSPU|nr:hypothetical protein [Nostoc punctiforme]MBD2612316.1 hypothetical protein [Nostoc punctiforme FACHB-252]MBL1203433.1 hypothetical protein [Nostoc sp. GBBB01]MDZ8013846.1 hypothetical protein [Nostoc sp. ZfuVER08]